MVKCFPRFHEVQRQDVKQQVVSRAKKATLDQYRYYQELQNILTLTFSAQVARSHQLAPLLRLSRTRYYFDNMIDEGGNIADIAHRSSIEPPLCVPSDSGGS